MVKFDSHQKFLTLPNINGTQDMLKTKKIPLLKTKRPVVKLDCV